jgi:hypothetical protein
MTKLSSLIVLLLSAVYGALNAASAMDTRIIRADTKSFNERELKFRYSEAQAREFLYAATKQSPNAVFDRRCLFIVGTEYMFGVARKDRLPLSGYYVDGNTGRIIKKTSTRYLKWFNRKLPKDPYEKEEVIRGGADDRQ